MKKHLPVLRFSLGLKIWTFIISITLFSDINAQDPIINYSNSNKILLNPTYQEQNHAYNLAINTGAYLNPDNDGNLFSTYNINGIVGRGPIYYGAIINNNNYRGNNTFSFEGFFSNYIYPLCLSIGIKAGIYNQNTIPKNITDRYNPHFLTDTSQLGNNNKTFPSFGAGFMFQPRMNSNLIQAFSFGFSASNVNQPVEFSDKKKSKMPIKYIGIIKSDLNIRKTILTASLVYEFQDRRIYDDILNEYLLSRNNDLALFVEDRYRWLVVGYGFHYLFEKTPANFIRLGYFSRFSITYDIGIIHPKGMRSSMLLHQIELSYKFGRAHRLSGLL